MDNCTKSSTGNTEYVIAEFGTLENGLVLTLNGLGSSVDPAGIADAVPTTTVSGISPSSTSGTGVGAIFTLVSSGAGLITNLVVTVTATSPGSGYTLLDTIKFSQSDLRNTGFGGSTLGDLVITLMGGEYHSRCCINTCT